MGYVPGAHLGVLVSADDHGCRHHLLVLIHHLIGYGLGNRIRKKQTNISVDANLLTMLRVHRVLWEVFPVPVDLINAA